MPEVRQSGPISYEVNATVTRGQLVMPDGTTGKIKPVTTAAVTTALGVARDDAAVAGSGASTDYGTLRSRTAVYMAPYEVEVTFEADAAFGQKVISAATAGQVKPVAAAAALDATSVVGYCTSPAGVLAGAKGRIKLV